MWVIQTKVKEQYAERFPIGTEWRDCVGPGWAKFDLVNAHLLDLRLLGGHFEYRAVLRPVRPVQIVRPTNPLEASGLCPNDQGVVMHALARLMEDRSERIRRNAMWAEDGRAEVDQYEASRMQFGAEYLAAVRAAGMC